MSHVRRLGSTIKISLPPDPDGLTGRECPNRDCVGYFKVQFGTGLAGADLPCYCPYCGTQAAHDHFFTREQIEYAKSVAVRSLTDAVFADLKELEFEHKPRGSFGIGLSMKVSRGMPAPIRHYREKKLETEVVCSGCTLRYAIYGVFAFCPDCGIHNSRQILAKNLELARKELELAAGVEKDLGTHLIEDALENVVSAFDGFGRESCRVRADAARDPVAAQNFSFQDLDKARARVRDLFGIDLADGTADPDWGAAKRGFLKRHLIAHKMGVVDRAYVDQADDHTAVVGRKVQLAPEEVLVLASIVEALADTLIDGLPPASPTAPARP